MGPPRLCMSNLETGDPINAQLLDAQSRLSHTHARLLNTLDALDSLRTSHHKELSALTQQKRSLSAKLRVYEQKLQTLEAERDDMRNAVEQLVDQVERSNSYSAWPCSRMKVSGGFAESSRLPAVSLNTSPNVSDYTSQVVNTLRTQLVAERTAHEQAKVRIAELEAKVARREAEIERLLVAPSGSHRQQSPSHDESVIGLLDANVRRNRMLEVEIKELTAKLANKRTSPISQTEADEPSLTLCAPPPGNAGVHSNVVRLTQELEQLSAAIDGLQGVRTDLRGQERKRKIPAAVKPMGSSKSTSAAAKSNVAASPVSSASKRSSPESQPEEIAPPKDPPMPSQQPPSPPLDVPTSPLHSSPNTSNPDWTGLRTPEPTVTRALGSPVALEFRPLRSNTAEGLKPTTDSHEPSDDDGERSMELATPLPSSSIVTSTHNNVTPGRLSRSRSNTPRRPPSRSRLRSPGTPSSMELATPLPSTSIVTSRLRSRNDRSDSHTPHRARAMTWSNPPSPSPSHHSAQYSLGVNLPPISPGTPTPLSRSQNSISEVSLTRSIRPENTFSPDSRSPSTPRLSPRLIPLPSSSEENTDSTSQGRRQHQRSDTISESSFSEWNEGGEGEDSFEREYSRERRHLDQNENLGKRPQSNKPDSEAEAARLKINLDEAKGKLMDGERALGELKDVFEGLRKVLVTRSSPRSERNPSTSTGASSSSR